MADDRSVVICDRGNWLGRSVQKILRIHANRFMFPVRFYDNRSARGANVTMKDAQYSGDWFESLVNSVKSMPVNGHDKRSSPRVGLSLTVDICDLHDGQAIRVGTVRLRDVSRTGVGFVTSKRLKPGGQFCLSFPRVDAPPLLIGYQCIHCRSVSERIFSVGAAVVWIGTPPAPRDEDQGTLESDEIKRIRQAMLR